MVHVVILLVVATVRARGKTLCNTVSKNDSSVIYASLSNDPANDPANIAQIVDINCV
jgi:hypothetical protein